MFLAKQELKSVPFQMLHESITLAKNTAKERLIKQEQDVYDRIIARKEEEWVGTHEAPFEGNFTDEFPFIPPSQEVILEEQMRVEVSVFTELADKLMLKKKATWLLPQVAAYISNMKLPRGEDGKIMPREFLKQFGVDDWHKGLYRYCMTPTRGLIVPEQYSEQFRGFSALVPLMMMPAKKYNNIPYMDWSRTNLSLVVDRNLYNAMTFDGGPLTLSREELLSIREKGLRVKSGKDEGKMRNPATTFQLYGINDSALGQFTTDKLVQVMLSQIWIAHPINRTKEMILDYMNWDNMPEQLIDTEVIPEKKAKTVKSGKILSSDDLPWDC